MSGLALILQEHGAIDRPRSVPAWFLLGQKEVTAMSRFLSVLFGLLTIAAVAAMGVIVTQNDQNARLAFLGNTMQFAQGWTIAGAAALGFLLAFLLLIPGRLASGLRAVGLSRQGRLLEERLRGLREEHTQLQGRHQRLLDEHQRMLNQMPAPVAAGERQAAAPLAMPAASAAGLPRTGPILPKRRLEDADAAAGPRQASLMERARRRVVGWRASVGAWFKRLRDRLRDRGGRPTRGDASAMT
jgi:uncharacterized integral membrane protein